MKTRTAFLMRFLLPPLYAATGLTVFTAVFEMRRLPEFFTYLGLFTLYAYVFAGLPALLFALLLGRFARRRPAFGGRLTRAALLGLTAGGLITAMFGFGGAVFFLPTGLLVGLAVEGTVALIERRENRAAD